MNEPPDTARPPTPRPGLPLARYRVRFREHPPEGVPSLASPRTRYLGFAWRGVFGRALRKTVCVTRLPACDPCALLRSCPYPFLFESRTPPGAEKLTRYPHTPGPYVLEPADPRFDTGEDGMVNLGVTLFGPANDHLPYVVHALDRAGRGGADSPPGASGSRWWTCRPNRRGAPRRGKERPRGTLRTTTLRVRETAGGAPSSSPAAVCRPFETRRVRETG